MDVIRAQQQATFRTQLASPAWWLLLAGAGLAAAIVAWFVAGDPMLGVEAMPAALAGAVAVTWWGAGQSAREVAYQAWAQGRGFRSTNALEAPLTTPLLQMGEERTLESAYKGSVAGLDAVVGHFTWISVRRRYREDGTVTEHETPHPYTVAQVVTGLSGVLRFSLEPRGTGAGLLAAADALIGPDRPVELESAELTDAFRLTVADEESEIAVRQLFTPNLIVEILAMMPSDDTRIEFENGALVVAVPHHRYEPELLDGLTGLAGVVAQRLRLPAAVVG
jgi:hypothetical protein